MHEYSICIALLRQVEELAEQHSAARVERIVLALGPLAGVEPELLRQAWPLAAAQSVAEEAELVLESTPLVVRCTRCGRESAVSSNRLICRECGDFRTRVISGEEMILQRVELLGGG